MESINVDIKDSASVFTVTQEEYNALVLENNRLKEYRNLLCKNTRIKHQIISIEQMKKRYPKKSNEVKK